MKSKRDFRTPEEYDEYLTVYFIGQILNTNNTTIDTLTGNFNHVIEKAKKLVSDIKKNGVIKPHVV